MKILQKETLTGLGVFFWWEKRRVLYNLIMLITGAASFYIGYVKIPLVYVLIAINLNILFTLSWIIQLSAVSRFKSTRITNAYIIIFSGVFLTYSIISVLFFLHMPQLINWTFYPYGFR